MNLIQEIHAATINILCEKAARSGDGFREYLYDYRYGIRQEVNAEIDAGIGRGLSAEQIADKIYSAH